MCTQIEAVHCNEVIHMFTVLLVLAVAPVKRVIKKKKPWLLQKTCARICSCSL